MVGQDHWGTGSSMAQLRRGSKSILGPCPRTNSSSPFLILHQQNFLVSSESSSFREISLVIYILLLSSSWLSICRLRRSPLEYLSHLALPSTCCELQWATWRCSGVIPSLIWPDCQLRAFNAKGDRLLYNSPFTMLPQLPFYASPFVWG